MPRHRRHGACGAADQGCSGQAPDQSTARPSRSLRSPRNVLGAAALRGRTGSVRLALLLHVLEMRGRCSESAADRFIATALRLLGAVLPILSLHVIPDAGPRDLDPSASNRAAPAEPFRRAQATSARALSPQISVFLPRMSRPDRRKPPRMRPYPGRRHRY